MPAFVSEGISEAEAKDIAMRYTVYVNKILGTCRGCCECICTHTHTHTALMERIISGKDVVLTLQVAGALFVVAKVAAVVSPLTLTWLGAKPNNSHLFRISRPFCRCGFALYPSQALRVEEGGD